jgi:hypothetical protein
MHIQRLHYGFIILLCCIIGWIFFLFGCQSKTTSQTNEGIKTQTNQHESNKQNEEPFLGTWFGTEENDYYILQLKPDNHLIYRWNPDYSLYGRYTHADDALEITMDKVIQITDETFGFATIAQKERWEKAFSIVEGKEQLQIRRMTMRGGEWMDFESVTFRRPEPDTQTSHDQKLLDVIRITEERLDHIQSKSNREQEIAAMLQTLPLKIGKPIQDRETWDTFANMDAAAQLIQKAEALLDDPIPLLTKEEYRALMEEQNQGVQGEAISVKSRMLTLLTKAECLENKGRFLPKLNDVITAFCDAITWVHPANDIGGVNVSGERLLIDLSVAGNGRDLATMLYLLNDRIPEELRTRLVHELKRRVIDPFMRAARGEEDYMWWMTARNNWTAVCISGVVGTAVQIIEDREELAEILAQAEHFISNYLWAFPPDGYCEEGLGYWNYGFGNFIKLTETIRRVTHGKWNLMANDFVKEIAQYPFKIEILPEIYPAIADCSYTIKPQHLFMVYVNKEYGFNKSEYTEFPQTLGGHLFQLALFSLDPPSFESNSNKTDRASFPLRDFFNHSSVLICRPQQDQPLFAVCIKGEDNTGIHNHNDVGTFIVVSGKTRLITDPGPVVYTNESFSRKRYENEMLSSYGHPVPVLAGTYQKFAGKTDAKVVTHNFTPTQDTLTLDLTAAYDVPELIKAERSYTYTRGVDPSLEVTDTISFSNPQTYESAIITFGEWHQLDESTYEVTENQDRIRITWDPAIPTKVTKTTLNAETHTETQPTRIGIQLVEPQNDIHFTLHISPIYD